MGVRLFGLGARTLILILFAIFFVAPILWLVLARMFRNGVSRGSAIAGIAGIALFAYGVAAIFAFNFVGP